MIKAYYENSKGEILNLLSYPFLTAEADWFDAEWRMMSGDLSGQCSLMFLGRMRRMYPKIWSSYIVFLVRMPKLENLEAVCE